MSNFTYGYNVYKSRLLLLRRSAPAGGKGLKRENIANFESLYALFDGLESKYQLVYLSVRPSSYSLQRK